MCNLKVGARRVAVHAIGTISARGRLGRPGSLWRGASAGFPLCFRDPIGPAGARLLCLRFPQACLPIFLSSNRKQSILPPP
jgi:hypothetical protein